LKLTPVTGDLSRWSFRSPYPQSVFTNPRTDFIHALFGSLSLGGIGLLLEDLIVVNVSSFVVPLFVVKLRDVIRIFGFASQKNLEIVLGLRNFFAVRIA
jgi:hypothetical protein